MRTLSMHHDAVRAHGGTLTLKAIAGAVIARLADWQERATERRILAHLDDRMLADVGLTRAELRRELDKGFWER
ncbi:DUF1127 domain-containing protein [Stella sp.]|uniref:DUF1127 domain-containing protein n=1 Tax=Stella sp. TaxID=2912054 RepID=UPI0035ADC618